MKLHITMHEGELILNALDFLATQIDSERSMADPAYRVAGRYVCRRAKELRDKINAVMESATQGSAP